VPARITLSFDNGPEPDVTPSVLAAPARHEAPATFFVIGSKLADPERRALAERAPAEGHRIGNHTYTHTVPLGWAEDPAAAAEEEIGRTQRLLAGLAGPERYFRPTGMGVKDQRLLSPAAVQLLKSGGSTRLPGQLHPDRAGRAGRTAGPVRHARRRFSSTVSAGCPASRGTASVTRSASPAAIASYQLIQPRTEVSSAPGSAIRQA
jgi:peptidoglycan/xylan/chitin deacetylase (PgdA/CDA1 family)